MPHVRCAVLEYPCLVVQSLNANCFDDADPSPLVPGRDLVLGVQGVVGATAEVVAGLEIDTGVTETDIVEGTQAETMAEVRISSSLQGLSPV